MQAEHALKEREHAHRESCLLVEVGIHHQDTYMGIMLDDKTSSFNEMYFLEL
jgi:hypothetical protein